jgi:hypothetical protein
MKKIVTLMLFSSVLFSCQAHAQGQLELYGLRSWAIPKPAFTDKGWGGGMNGLTDPFVLIGKNSLHPFDVQFGGQFYMSGLGMRKFKGVPLAEPLTGNAKVKFDNLLFGLNAFIRFSSPNAITGFIPYVDIFGGARFISSEMTIFPDHVPPGYDESTNSQLKTVTGLNYGAGFGLQRKIAEGIYFDCELLWSYSPTSKSMVDLNTAHRYGDGLVYDLKSSPYAVALLKVGFNFCIENDSGRSSCHHNSCSSGNNQHYYSGGHSSSVHVSSGGGGVHAVAK